MIRKLSSPVCGHVRVTFELPSCIWADRIYVAGDFNDWSHTSTPMRQGRDGIWRASVDLPAGPTYEFRYLIDGKWQTDYHADGRRGTEFGSENSIVDTALATIEPMRETGTGSLLREGLPVRPTPAVVTPPPLMPKPVPAARPVSQAAA